MRQERILLSHKRDSERECEQVCLRERRINGKNECVCVPHGGTGGII